MFISLVDDIRRDTADADPVCLHGLREHDGPEIEAPQDVQRRGIPGADRGLVRVVARPLHIEAVGEPAHPGRGGDRRRPRQDRPDGQRQCSETTHVRVIPLAGAEGVPACLGSPRARSLPRHGTHRSPAGVTINSWVKARGSCCTRKETAPATWLMSASASLGVSRVNSAVLGDSIVASTISSAA